MLMLAERYVVALSSYKVRISRYDAFPFGGGGGESPRLHGGEYSQVSSDP